MTERLIQKIRNAKLSLNIEKTEFDKYFELRQLKKGETLLDFNSVCRNYYFLNKGVLRVFYLNNGQEITGWLAFEDYFFTEYESYNSGLFSNYSITAIENCELLEISKAKMDYLLDNYPFWQHFINITQQEIIIKLIEVLKQFQTKTASDRYEELFKYPDFIQCARQKDISTMIGVTKHSLSRIRKKK